MNPKHENSCVKINIKKKEKKKKAREMGLELPSSFPETNPGNGVPLSHAAERTRRTWTSLHFTSSQLSQPGTCELAAPCPTPSSSRCKAAAPLDTEELVSRRKPGGEQGAVGPAAGSRDLPHTCRGAEVIPGGDAGEVPLPGPKAAVSSGKVRKFRR